MSKPRSPVGGAPPVPGGKRRKSIRDREDRAEIEFKLATGQSVRQIANDHGVHESALHKWRKRNLSPQLCSAYMGRLLKPGVDLEKLKTEESSGLLQSLATQRARLLLSQDAALELENGQLVATLSNAIHRNLELVARYLGEMQQHSTKTVQHVLMTPEYLALRAALIKALAPFPEARRAVAAAFHEAESNAAARTSQQIIDVTPALAAPTQ